MTATREHPADVADTTAPDAPAKDTPEAPRGRLRRAWAWMKKNPGKALVVLAL